MTESHGATGIRDGASNMTPRLVKLATHRLTDAVAEYRSYQRVWTVAYSVGGDGFATIHGYGLYCEAGYEQEKTLDRCRLFENDGHNGDRGVVVRLQLQPHEGRCWPTDDSKSTFLVVANPRHILTYGEVTTTVRHIGQLPYPHPLDDLCWRCQSVCHWLLDYSTFAYDGSVGVCSDEDCDWLGPCNFEKHDFVAYPTIYDVKELT